MSMFQWFFSLTTFVLITHIFAKKIKKFFKKFPKLESKVVGTLQVTRIVKSNLKVHLTSKNHFCDKWLADIWKWMPLFASQSRILYGHDLHVQIFEKYELKLIDFEWIEICNVANRIYHFKNIVRCLMHNKH